MKLHRIIENLCHIQNIFQKGVCTTEAKITLKTLYENIMVHCSRDLQKQQVHRLLSALIKHNKLEETLHTLFGVQEEKELKENNEWHNILTLASLAYTFEKNGNETQHAKKLSVMCDDLNNVLVYLHRFSIEYKDNDQFFHDACLFTLPDACDKTAWKNIARNNTWYNLVKNKEFREYVLPS